MAAQTTPAAVAIAPGVTELREVPLPQPDIATGLLRVAATGVCGSDWMFYQTLPRQRGPAILGHETVGWIEAMGSLAAQRWGVQEGDLVALEEYIPCGHCEFCRSGDFRFCDVSDWRRGGLRYGATPLSVSPGLWGGYAGHQHLHINTVFHRVPASVTPAHAALALPLANGIEWTYFQGKAGPGQVVVIQGPGQQGLSCVVAAREAGVEKIIVTGLSNPTDRRRMELARLLGAHHTIDIEHQDLLETVADLTGGHMADLVLDCASGGPGTVVSAIQLARKRGRVILAGQKGGPVPAFDSNRIVANVLTVQGTRGHSYQSVELALALIAGNRHNVTAMSTHSFALHDTDLALRSLAGQGVDGPIHMTVIPGLKAS